jgi:hypothetical protein
MMHTEKANAIDGASAGIGSLAGMIEQACAEGHYTVQCFDKDGNLKWEDTIENAVCAEGKNYVLDKAFAGSAFTAAWYVGLFNSGYSPVGTETYAAKGGTENTNYSQANRPTAAWASASAGSKSLSSAAVFSINGAGGTIAGCFLCCGSSTKGDSTASAGVNALWSIGAFSGGNKAVASGDTLNVSYSTSL